MYTLIYKKKLFIIYATVFMFIASHLINGGTDQQILIFSQQLNEESDLPPSLLWSFLQNPNKSTGVGGVLYTEDFHIPVWELKETYKENEAQFECGKFFMVVVTNSAVEHVDQRAAIRNTWGRYPGKSYRNFFVLGKSDSYDGKKLKQEIEKYRDIIQGDFIDSPENATIKSMFAHRVVLDHCDFQFVVQTTDETYVNVAALMDNLHSIEQHAAVRSVNLGLLSQEDTQVQRSGTQINVTTDQFPFPFFPRFTLGFARILSHSAVEVLLRKYKYISPFPVDDAYIGYVLARAGVTPCGPNYHSNSYFIPHPKHQTDSCSLNDIFMMNCGDGFVNSSSIHYGDGVFAHRHCAKTTTHFKKLLVNCEKDQELDK